MIGWGEEMRLSDPFFFCRKTVNMAKPECTVWIVPDARRHSDIQFFREFYSEQLKCVRITAPEDVRKERGFVFTPGEFQY